MTEEITATVEEYLECIYRLQRRSGVARTSDIVKQMHVVPGTVTNTIERLEREGLVTHKPYKGVKLTEKGQKKALDVLRRHRLSERLLTDILNVEWSKVHNEACRLEHGITDNVVKNLDEALGHPKTCPHGNPIPTKSGEILEEISEVLTSLNPSEKGVILKITEEKPKLLQYLASMGLKPGVSLEVEEKAPLNGPITLKVAEKSLELSREISSTIRIKTSTSGGL